MPTFLDLNKSINNVLKEYFPSVEIYSTETKEGFNEPCFFTNIIPLNSENEINYTHHKLMIVIDYYGKNKTKIEAMEIDNDLRGAFGMSLRVNQRSFLIQEITSTTIDGVLQFKFNLDYLVSADRKKNLGEKEYDLMQEIYLDMKRRD